MNKIGFCLLSTDSSTVSAKDYNVKTFIKNNNLLALAGSSSDQHIIPEYTPISNQGSLGSCVANATCDAFEILRGLNNPNDVDQLSRLFVYWNARLYTKDTDKDKGTYITNAMYSLVDYGVCSESLWKYDVSKVFTQPNQLAYKQGDDNRLSNFYKIRSTGQARLEEIEAAIKSNHPVVFATAVDNSFNNFSGDKVITPPTSWSGYHAMVITGVRRNPNLEFYVRNSWGKYWGDDGHVWLSDSYISWNQTSDIYVGTQMDDLLV